jgi:hypothetical protein
MSDSLPKLPVYLRLKPKTATSAAEPFLTVAQGSGQVIVEPPKDSRYKAQEAFSFNGVFRESCGQNDVYKSAVHPLVENVLRNGSDSLLFTMGCSGSGKTHTVLGYKQTPGMVQLAVDSIFRSVKDKLAEFETLEAISDKNRHRTSSAVEVGLILDWDCKSKTDVINSSTEDVIELNDKYRYGVYISMVEIYNDRIFDLFDETKSSSSAHRKGLLINTDPETGKTCLTDVRKIFVSDKEEAFRTIDYGLSLRTAHATGSNMCSSRSHAFIMIDLKKIPKDNCDGKIYTTTLTIADLAGSERIKISKTNGNRLVESCAINKSLMLLGQCLQKQRDKEHHANKETKTDTSIFRNSKLTQLLLANAFNGSLNQRSVLLVNIDRYGDFSSASQMLRYSALAREVAVPQTRVTSLSSLSSMSSATLAESDNFDTGADTFHLVQRIEDLEQALAMSEQACLEIEEQVRNEMADEMERRVHEVQTRFWAMLEDENERGLELRDKQLDIMRTVVAGEQSDQTNELRREIAIVRRENELLSMENQMLRNEPDTTRKRVLV